MFKCQAGSAYAGIMKVLLLLETLSKVHPDFPNYSHEFPKSLVCTLPTEDCWNNKCSSCKDKKIFNFDLETASLLN